MTYAAVDRRTAVRDLQAVHRLRGTVPAALVRDIASDIGCSERTVWGWWRNHREATCEPDDLKPQVRVMPEAFLEVLFAAQGNVSQAHRELLADPETAAITPPRRTLAHWRSKVDAPVRAFASEGAEGLMNKQQRARYEVDERNQLWAIDHQEFPVWVFPHGRSTTPVKPWLTTVQDAYTRTILSFLLTVEAANATTVGVALADAIRLKPTTRPDVELGGVPLAVLSDNGGEFKSDQYRTMPRRLGIASRRTYPYMKHLNGKVERVQRTMQRDVAQKLPGFSEGPKTLTMKDLFGLDGGSLISEELLVAILEDWVYTYNNDRPHQSLGGSTPMQVWAEQQTPLRAPDMEAVRLAMMKTAVPRKVTHEGVSFKGRHYGGGELTRLRLTDQTVDVRFLPHDDSFIEIFDGDRWLCTAYPTHKLSEADRDLMQQVRREQYLTARGYHEAARKRRQRAVATATPDSPRPLPLSAAAPDSLRGGDDDLFALSETETDERHADVTTNELVEIGHAEPDPWELATDTDDPFQTTT